MDGYVLTYAATALKAFDHPGVRHFAELDDGLGFLAFEGAIPCEGIILEAAESELKGRIWHRGSWGGAFVHVRKRGPMSAADPERLFLFASEADFRDNDLSIVPMATLLTDGWVLALTLGDDLDHAVWSAFATRVLDKRLAA
jgi:hypothetical protein